MSIRFSKWKFLQLFSRSDNFDVWPKSILLKIIFLNRAYIRQMCCYCQRTLKFKRSERVIGDSGDVCPTCLRKVCRELYEQMKSEGSFTAEQIREAEKS